MKTHKIITAILIFLAILLIASFIPGFRKTVSQDPNNVVNLVRPAFLQTAHAQEGPEGFDIGQMLDEEAGISAYFQTSGPIELDLVDDLYTTIEIQTAEYILGSIAITNYPEIYAPHVYIHADGWILAYYFDEDPIAKIIDIKAYTIDTTLLKNMVALVAGTAGEPFTDVTYYDFRYPNATNMMFIIEYSNSGDNYFTINLPSEFGYSERSWALVKNCCYGYFILDGIDMIDTAIFWSEWEGVRTGYGTISFSQLLPDIDHTIQTDDTGVLVILYTVPE